MVTYLREAQTNEKKHPTSPSYKCKNDGQLIQINKIKKS